MRISPIRAIALALIAFSLPACQTYEEQAEQEHYKIVVTSPKVMDVDITQQYVCQIHSQRHIQIRALQDGYLQEIRVKEGQRVKKDAKLFIILPTIYQARLDTELAEVKIAKMELKFTDLLSKRQGVSENEVALYEAKLKRAEAKAKLAKAELDFTEVKAPFDGIIDRLHEREGSLIKERDILTTLSDNSLMWVYFNVPEARYLEYMASSEQEKEDQRIELLLANGSKFKYRDASGNWATTGHFQPFNQNNPAGAIEAKFNNENGNIAFRADFPNPARLLRHGMTGNILIHRPLRDAVVIPQRATFEILDRRYVFVVDEQQLVHQREISVQHELDDVFVINNGLSVKDKFIFEGVRQVRDGEKIEYDLRPVDQILANQKFHAE